MQVKNYSSHDIEFNNQQIQDIGHKSVVGEKTPHSLWWQSNVNYWENQQFSSAYQITTLNHMYLIQVQNSKIWRINQNVQGAICVQHIDDHVSCSSHDDAQFAAVFIDPWA